jgi:epoxyqueuosine reductase
VEASTRTAAPAYDHALRVITEFLDQRGYRTAAGHELPLKAAAVRAGVAVYGRNCTVHADGIGSYLAVAAVLTDAELACTDRPVETSDCPEDCGACVEACPTGALSRERPFRLTRERCICSYLWGAPIPREHREAIGDRLFRCEACTTACRRNQTLTPRSPNGYTPQEGEDSPELLPLLHGDLDYFRRSLCGFVQQAGLDTLRRNAAIAAGNSGDPMVVSGLVACLESPHLLTRVAAVWALGRLGGAAAARALTTRLGMEGEEEVRTEIAQVLGSIPAPQS